MGGADWKRIGTGVVTGGLSEVPHQFSAVRGGGDYGGGKGSGGPTAPDFTAAAQEQIRANRPNQTGPFSSSQWSQDANGNWSQNTSLNGGLGQGASNLMGQIGSQGPVGTGDEARQQAIDSAYGQAASRLDPQWGQREESTRAMLANQGLDPGSEAFGAEMGNFGRDRNDAYTSAMANAINQGTAAGHVAFSDNLQAQNAPYQQLGMLQNLSQPAPFMGASGLTDAMGQKYQGDLNKYATQQSGKNSMMGGAARLAPLLFL